MQFSAIDSDPRQILACALIIKTFFIASLLKLKDDANKSSYNLVVELQ